MLVYQPPSQKKKKNQMDTHHFIGLCIKSRIGAGWWIVWNNKNSEVNLISHVIETLFSISMWCICTVVCVCVRTREGEDDVWWHHRILLLYSPAYNITDWQESRSPYVFMCTIPQILHHYALYTRRTLLRERERERNTRKVAFPSAFVYFPISNCCI